MSNTHSGTRQRVLQFRAGSTAAVPRQKGVLLGRGFKEDVCHQIVRCSILPHSLVWNMHATDREGAGRAVLVYHEKQSLFMQHCAVHTLNNVLQAPLYTAEHFEGLAQSLQHGRFPDFLSEREEPSVSRCPQDGAQQAQYRGGVDSTAAESQMKCTITERGSGLTLNSRGRAAGTEEASISPADDTGSPSTDADALAREAGTTQLPKPQGATAATSLLAQTPAEQLFRCEALTVAKTDPRVPWRARISCVLLGTDYSAPLGIGNYDLSLLQQLLCFHRLSINFANTPSRRLMTGSDDPVCGLPTCAERSGQRAPRPPHSREHPTFSTLQQQLSVGQTCQSTRCQQQRGQQREALPEEVIPPARSPSQSNSRLGRSSGYVTVEQLRNPRLLAFILNVKMPRTGWRRLLPVPGAERHFYTIRKISCRAAACANSRQGFTTKHFVTALLPGIPGALHAGARARDDTLQHEAEQGGDAAISEKLYTADYQDPEKEAVVRQPPCGSQFVGGGADNECPDQADGCSSEALSGGTPCRPRPGRCGVDFVWLDLDSNLSSPRVFESENALVTHLNRMLQEAFVTKVESSRRQRVPRTQAERKVCTQGTANAAHPRVASGGEGFRNVSPAGLSARVVSGLEAAPVSSLNADDTDARDYGFFAKDANQTLRHGSTETRQRSYTDGDPQSTHNRDMGANAGRAQFSERADAHLRGCGTRAGNAAHQPEGGRSSSRGPGNSGAALSPPPPEKRVQLLQERASTGLTGIEHDGVCYNPDSARVDNHGETVTWEQSYGAVSSSKDEEDSRGYRDLILIEVLQDRERS